MQPQRDLHIDFLRFIGISLIILAHVEAPSGITQFRCFDVPLMVFVSGLSFRIQKEGGGILEIRMEAGKTVVHSGLPVFDHFVCSSHQCRDCRIEKSLGLGSDCRYLPVIERTEYRLRMDHPGFSDDVDNRTAALPSRRKNEHA